MWINRKASSMLCGVSALLLACDGSERDPVAPRNDASTATALASKGASGAGASGYAEIHGTTVQGIRDEIFSFTALSTGSAIAAMGQVAVHFLIGEDDGATDLASLVFFPSASDGDLAFCNTRPAVPVLRQSTNGGIQVRSE